MKRIYCISGMGADFRIFKRLDIAGYELVSLPWVPYAKTDTLESYALRMAENISDPDPVLLGLSFGGMLSVEIAKHINVKKIILISSAKTCAEVPDPGWLAKKIVMSGLIPAFFFSLPNSILLRYLGVIPFKDTGYPGEGSVKGPDGRFMKWALKMVMGWANRDIPPHVVHIHGTNDTVIPAARVRPTYWVKGAGHVMIFARAHEISALISQELSGLT